MKKGLIGLVIIVLLAGGAVLFFKNRSSDKDTKDSSTTSSTETAKKTEQTPKSNQYNSSIKSIIAMGKSVKCTFSFVDAGVTSAGTAYFAADKRARVDFKNSGGDKNLDGSMILTADKQYVWDQTKKIGSTFDTTGVAKQSNGGISSDKVIDFQCNDWTLDAAVLTPPADVRFVALPTTPIQ